VPRSLVVRSFTLVVLAAGLAESAACTQNDGGTGPLPDAGADGSADAATGEDAGGLAFPSAFLWGTATAGFQVDMGCPSLADAVCTDRGSDWYAYATDPRMLGDSLAYLSGDDPAVVGPGNWELYDADLTLAAQQLANNAYRFGIEWSRIFPQPTDGVEGYENLRAIADPDAVAHYHAVLDAARRYGLTPLVTINHYSLPTWIHDGVGCHFDLGQCTPRGWLDRDRTVREIAKYAGFLAAEYGAKVDLWATENEPFAIVVPGYVYPTADRTNPPDVMLRLAEAREVMRALIEAHARMYDAIKAADLIDADGDGAPSVVGLVYALIPVAPRDPENALDVQGAQNFFYLWNLAFLNAVALGSFDANLDGSGEFREDLAGRLDYLGMNYYYRMLVPGTATPVLPELSPLTTVDITRVEFDNDHPQGMYDMAVLLHETYHLPIYVTENGTSALPEEGQARYLVRHLTALHQAIDYGVDVRGYFVWTLMDNFEWNHGAALRMGLFAVDPTSKARTPRLAAGVYGQIAAGGAISPALLDEYPLGP
jgi:beta-galactosidase